MKKSKARNKHIIFANNPTQKQKEILQLIAEGHVTKEIADILCISVRTVERHKYNIMQKLDLKTTADLVRYAIKEGIISI